MILPEIIALLTMLIFSLGAGLAYSLLVRRVQYHNQGCSDNELMAYAAAQSGRWKWFSDLHKMGKGKTGMKDVTIILIAVLQRIFRDKEGDYPYTALGGIANAFSGLLVFLIVAEYFGAIAALFVGSLFLFSLWNWQIALYGGHANVATMLFLLSVFFIQQTGYNFADPIFWLLLSGFIFCMSQFASASSIKYTPLYLAAVVHARYRTTVVGADLGNVYSWIWDNQLVWFNLAVITFYLSAIIILRIGYRKLVAAMYYQTAPKFLNRIISGRDKFPLDFYLAHARKRVRQLGIWGLYATIGVLLLANLVGWAYLSLILAGFAVGFLVLTLPDVKKSFRYYFEFLLETQIRKKSHFRLYVDYFAKRGLAVSRYTQGAGLIWLPRVFFRIVPVHTVIFLAATAGAVVSVFTATGSIWINSTNIALLLVISLSPIIWAEITRAPQLSRTYSPGLVGLFLTIGYGAYLLQTHLHDLSYPIFAGLVLVALSWNLWKFVDDVYPPRMCVADLIKTLNDLKIKEFYTYKTDYNKHFVDAIPGFGEPGYLPKKNITPPFTVHYINSIADVKNGWIAIPCTSSKALHMNTEREAIDGGDYTKDPVLNKLLETKEIESVATAKFKTMGTSTIWPVESEVTGFRDLILREITDKDRYRGFAWLLHTDKLKIKTKQRDYYQDPI